MSPTIFREGPFRFFFFSREEPRLHVHAESSEGEAKFWLDPEIELAKNYRLSDRDVGRIRDIIAEREQEIRDAWNQHFES
ncbi:MAG: DUF4160 domain-containing protein [Planctomycetota bacterium]